MVTTIIYCHAFQNFQTLTNVWVNIPAQIKRPVETLVVLINVPVTKVTVVMAEHARVSVLGSWFFFFIVILYIRLESTWMTSLNVDNSSFGVMIILDLVELCFPDFHLQILMNALEDTVVLSMFVKTLLDLIFANARKASLEMEHHA